MIPETSKFKNASRPANLQPSCNKGSFGLLSKSVYELTAILASALDDLRGYEMRPRPKETLSWRYNL